MKKIILFTFPLLATILVVFANPIIGSSASANIDRTREVLNDIVTKYIQNIDDHRYSEAYSMTAESFQAIIPLNSYVAYFNHLKPYLTSKYKIGSVTISGEKEAELDVTFTRSSIPSIGTTSSECIFNFTKEGEEWKIRPDWYQFYSTKVDLLSPIAEFEKDGVKATLKYIVLYPATKDTQAFTHIRIDIKNNSGRQICWQLPIPGTSEGYLTDPSDGRIYYPSHAYGILAKRSQDFAYIPAKYGSGTMLIGNNAEATLYIHITEIIPDDTKELNLFLSGLSFCDNYENWDIAINNAKCRFEVVPNQ